MPALQVLSVAHKRRFCYRSFYLKELRTCHTAPETGIAGEHSDLAFIDRNSTLSLDSLLWGTNRAKDPLTDLR